MQPWRLLRQATPFIDFALFGNRTFTGATVSNFLLNGTIGLLIVSQQLLQIGGGLKASDAGLLTIGYAVTIIAFIRLGEKLLQRFGPRKPMIWGSLIVGLATLLLMPTNLLLVEYRWFAVVAYALFGLGLAFYATPSTDAALASLPAEQAGAGSGIYKMASSLGSAIGAVVSLALFTAFGSSGAQFVGDVLINQGRTDNTAVRQAAVVALAFTLLMVVVASIMVSVPKGKEPAEPAQQAPAQWSPEAARQEEEQAMASTAAARKVLSEGLGFLAWGSPGVRERILAGLGPERAAVERKLGEAAAAGYTTSEAVIDGVAAIAAPVFDAGGSIVATLALVAPVGVLDTAPQSPHVADLKAAATALSATLGASTAA